MDWLVVWGVAHTVGFAFKDILVKLAQEGFEEYLKDFFKESAGELVDLAKAEPLKVAFGQAQKEFLSIVQQELEEVELTDEEIASYQEILSEFICNKSVLTILGKPVEQKLGIASYSKDFDIGSLDGAWKALALSDSYQDLPKNFKWERVSKKYCRIVGRIVVNYPELRELLNAENLRQIKETLEQQAPILPGFDLSSYQQSLKDAYQILDLDTLALSGWENSMLLWNIFTPQEVTDYNNQTSDSLSILELINEINSHKYLVIIGNPGAGKSTLTRYKVMEWIEQEIINLPVSELPILIELTNYVKNFQGNSCKKFLEYLQHGSGVKGGNLNQQELDRWFHNNQSLIMFDGLDEIIDGATRESIVTDIINFKNSYPKAKIVITSRIIGYAQQKSNLENAGFKTFLLKDFESPQINKFLNEWHKFAFTNNITDGQFKCDRLQKSIDKFPAFKELAGNPLLLTMMAILNRHEKLPRDRATLYERASEILLYKWEADKYLPIDEQQDLEVRDYLKNSSTYKDKIAMLRMVAYKIQKNGTKIDNILVIDEDTLETILTDYLKDIIPTKPRIIARAFIQDMTERSFILCFLGDGNYGFIHKTFLEYFCAADIVYRFEKTRTLTIEEIKQNYFLAKYQDESWHEILVLIVNILDETWAEELLQCIIEQDSRTCEYKNLFLAVNCLSDIRNILNVQSIISKVSITLEDIVSDRTNVNSEIHMRAVDALKRIQSL